jgi:hypothetical protein
MKRVSIAIGAALVLVCIGLTLAQGSSAPAQSTAKTSSAKSAKPATSADALDRLLAPVALYPDQLLAQMLLCAANPGKVGALSEWLASNQTLKGSGLQDAAVKAGFEPSFVALALFPQVVEYMAGNIEWTRALGEAFAADRNSVIGSVQRLRTQAQKAGTLKSTPQQDVETRTTSSGQEVIVIEPANPQVVYVPQYNPQVVYTQPTSTTVVVQQESSSSSDAAVAGMIGFTAGIAMGAAFDNDYYYGPGWYGGPAYMYNDAWDDYYDHREDAREDWQDNREELAEQRGDRAENAQEQRTERQENRVENRPEATQAQRDQARSQAQSRATEARSSGTVSQESRGYSGEQRTQTQRSGTSSDAFSGYSSGKSQRAASSRGQASRGSSRSGGGRRR